MQQGTWSVTASTVHTLKSLHSQCAFVKTLLSAHVSARCFYSRYVDSHHRGAHVQSCSCSEHVSRCTLHAVPTLKPSFLRWFCGLSITLVSLSQVSTAVAVGVWGVTAFAERVYKPLLEQCACGPLLSQLCIRSLRPHVQVTVRTVTYPLLSQQLHSQSACSSHCLISAHVSTASSAVHPFLALP